MAEISPPHITRKPSRLRRLLPYIILLAVIGAIVWFVETRDNSNPSPPQGRRSGAAGGPVTVGTAIAGKGDIDITYQALGTVTALANITVRTQINGQLLQVAFQEGQLVQAGDFLAQVDPRPYEAALEQAEGSLQRDQALLKEAQLDLERYRKLLTQDSIAKQQVDQQQSLVQQYQGAVTTDQGQIDNDKLQIAYCHIVSPVTGRVGLRQVDAGNYVQTGDANGLVTITELQPISVLFTLPEDNLPTVAKRFGTGAELPVTAYDRTRTTKLATGKLIALDNQIDTTTGTIKLRAQFDNADTMLFPNQFVNVELLADTMHDAVIVPSEAVQHGAPGTFVYLVKDDSTVTIKPVKLGPSQGDKQAILDGVQPNDKVVIDGTDKLREGAKVTLEEDAAKNAAGKGGDGKDNSGQPDSAKPHHRHGQTDKDGQADQGNKDNQGSKN